jgi:outer membrane receptor protein involved in Fe transport
MIASTQATKQQNIQEEGNGSMAKLTKIGSMLLAGTAMMPFAAIAQNVAPASAAPQPGAVAGAPAPQAEPMPQVAPDPADAPQTAPTPQTTSSDDKGDIVITGSNVIRNGYQAPTPVTTVTTEQLSATSPTRLGDALITLPQFRGSTSPRTTYQATLGIGGSTLSLRNLGSNRTLVLIDGRRWVPNSSRGDYDTDIIPQTLVTRVDVVTGGASAQYGSDAVGGVVNFILDTKFEGLKGSIQKGISTYGDGPTFKADLAGGFKFADGRGHVIASASFSQFAEIDSQASRPWGQNFPGLITVTGAPGQQFFNDVGQPASYGGAIISGPLAGIQFTPNGGTAPYNLGNPRNASATVGADGTHLIQPITSGLKSTVLFAHSDFEVSDAFKPFIEASAAHNHTRFAQGYPNYQFGSTAFTIFSGNPFLPASVQSQMTAQNIPSFQLQRVSQDLGMTIADLDNRTINVQGGFDGKSGNWSFGAYGGYGQTNGKYDIINNIDIQRLYAAADAVRSPGGQIVCRVTITNPGLFPGCVPINLFGNGSPSAAAAAYVKRNLPYSPTIQQEVGHAYLRGEPFSTWAGPVAIAVGADYRHQYLRQTTDPLASQFITGAGIQGFPSAAANRNGGFTTLNPQAATGSVSVWEGSGEVLVPLAKDLPWAKSLDLNGAVRYTNYSTSGGVTTWKVGLTYAPTGDIRFRGTYSKDIRAPSLGELYLAGISAQVGINDPKEAGRSYIIFSRGVANPSLAPEIGKTYSVGMVLTPSFFPGFSASVDYYNIKIDGVISTLTQQQTIDACQQGSAYNCGLISRDATTNDIVNINLPSQNLSSLKTSGIDIDLSYAHPLASGTVRLRAIGSYTPTYITQVPGTAAINYAGEIGVRATGTSNQSNAKFAGNLILSYDSDTFGMTVQERFIGQGTYDVTKVEGVTISDNSIPAVLYTDLTLKYGFKTFGGSQELFLTVNNLFNKAPPLFPTGSPILPSEYNRTLYDGIGRFFTAGVRFKF